MRRLFKLYKDLLRANHDWIRRAAYLAVLSFVIGSFTFFIRPELLEEIQNFVEEIVGEGELALNFSTMWLIFTNNLQAVLLSVLGGVVLGLLPLLTIAVNFFALGFIFALFAFGSVAPVVDLPGVLVYLAAILPHGIIEIPALLIASGFGLKFGFFWTKPYKDVGVGRNFMMILKEVIIIFPLLVLLLLLAALVEIFITGNLIEMIIR